MWRDFVAKLQQEIEHNRQILSSYAEGIPAKPRIKRKRRRKPRLRLVVDNTKLKQRALAVSTTCCYGLSLFLATQV